MSMLVLNLLGSPGGQKIRGTLAPDGAQWFAVFDTINFTCAKPEQSSYGNTTFFRLTQEGSEFKKEVLSLCKNFDCHPYPPRGHACAASGVARQGGMRGG